MSLYTKYLQPTMQQMNELVHILEWGIPDVAGGWLLSPWPRVALTAGRVG